MPNQNMSAPVGFEAFLFAVMVGIISTVALMIVGELGPIWAITLGVAIAVVVWVIVRVLLGSGSLPPPRGEGNLDLPGSPPSKTSSPEVAAPSAPAPKAEAAPAALTAVATPSAGSAADAVKPALLSEARDGGADDLKKIKGVGPKLEGLLHSTGVFHFDQIAKWSSAEVAWMDDNLEGFKGRVSRDEWVSQAQLLSGGGETEFSQRVEGGDVY